MNAELIHMLIIAVDIVIAVVAVLVVHVMLKNRVTDEELIMARKLIQKQEHVDREEKYRRFFFRSDKSYLKKQVYLSKVGVSFHIGRNVSPTEFSIYKLIMVILTGIIGISVMGVPGILIAIIGYHMPEMLFNSLNNSDNEKMLEDIKSLYDSMLISMESGVFLTEALSNSYRLINSARLKKAILELNSEIVATNDMETAVDKFELKFRNSYINDLCVLLRQQSKAGLSLTMIADMSNKMTDVANALNIKKKRKLDNQGFLVEVLIYIGIIGVISYICFSMLTSTMTEL